MPVATHRRPERLAIPRPERRTTTPGADVPEATSQEIYDLLSEAADLVTRASRQLRYASQTEAGFALQPVADEIHEHIRRLPASVSDRPTVGHHDFLRTHV